MTNTKSFINAQIRYCAGFQDTVNIIYGPSYVSKWQENEQSPHCLYNCPNDRVDILLETLKKMKNK